MNRLVKNKNAIVLMLYICIIFLIHWSLLLGYNEMKWDIMEAHYPNSMFLANSLRSGILPLWNPTFNFGTPHYAIIGMPVWYPTTLFMALLGYPLWSVGAEYSFHMVLACFGMYLYMSQVLKEHDKDRNSIAFALFAGLFYGISTVFLSNAQHIMIVISAAWLPWVLYFVKKHFETKRLLFLMLAALCTGINILGGYPEIWVAQFLILIPVFLKFNYSEVDKGKSKYIFESAKLYVLYGIFSFFAGAVTLIPFACISRSLGRMGGGADVAPFSFVYLFSAIIPRFWEYIMTNVQVIDRSMISCYMGIITVVSLPELLKRIKKVKFFI